MLGSPHHGLIGCHSLDAATLFLSEIGFTEVRDEVLSVEDPGGLYGLGTTINQRWLAAPRRAIWRDPARRNPEPEWSAGDN